MKDRRIKPRTISRSETTMLSDFYLCKQATDPSWRPYCLSSTCDLSKRDENERMIKTSFGFECLHCGNKLTKTLNKYKGKL